GYVSLYIGMPVILKDRNLSTELKVTNGAQGTVYAIDTRRMGGEACPRCVLVHFPTSPVQLPGLPTGVYPIIPQTSYFPHVLSPSAETVRVVRKQLPIQPGFAITGHGAQGRTMLAVIADLTRAGPGSYGGYVAASRAMDRSGLAILK
ncbi:hypothetical protein SISNIDRAFT_397518, partial [Sistotremastrum niveocremeum HHB9708]